MKRAYLDCASGISGDMLLGALVDAGAELAAIQAGIDSLGLPDCRLELSETMRHGFRAAKLDVRHGEQSAHRHLHHIVALIDGSRLTAPQRHLAKTVFEKIAVAEAKIHGTTVEKIHFHEVGAVDSIADIVGTAIAWDLLGIQQASASPVPTGGGFIEIAHGRCPVPAPATAELLRGVPLVPSEVQAELTTPTGAALLTTLATRFESLPAMTVESIGYGAGQRHLDGQANILRVLIGAGVDSLSGADDEVWVVTTNLDDASGEVIGYCAETLREAGALDVYSTAIQMKKGRPGVMLTALCREAERDAIEAIFFAQTGTLGVRRWLTTRQTLPRETTRVTTTAGEVEGIVAGEPARFSPEFESCRRLAETSGIPLREIYREAVAAFDDRPR